MEHMHQWVKHIVVPVDVVADPTGDGGFYAFEDPDRLKQADLEAVYGCAACSEPLNGDTVGTTCLGSDKSLDRV